MEIKFITDNGVNDTPKQMNVQMNDLRGKIQSILDNNYILESFKITYDGSKKN
jgi:hypothetical protein